MRLLKLSNNEFIIIKGDSAKYFSNMQKLIGYAKEIEMDLNELTIGFIEMNKYNHNYIEFGDIGNGFMFTGKL